MHVSHETIYRTLYVQTRGALKKELSAHLRRSRGYRRNPKPHGVDDGRGRMVDAVPISMRPPEAADRAVPGHWEGDKAGAGTRRLRHCERKSRFLILVRLKGRDTVIVTKALADRIRKLPKHLKQSLTWDRGREMAQHKAFTVATELNVYFCDPQSQRGSNEYFPRGMDLSLALKLNT